MARTFDQFAILAFFVEQAYTNFKFKLFFFKWHHFSLKRVLLPVSWALSSLGNGQLSQERISTEYISAKINKS